MGALLYFGLPYLESYTVFNSESIPSFIITPKAFIEYFLYVSRQALRRISSESDMSLTLEALTVEWRGQMHGHNISG